MESWKINDKHRQYSYKTACKRHPKHRQSPGVCSVCLSEKLSQLTNKINKGSKVVANSQSSSSSELSSLSSSNVSSYLSSPVANNRRLRVDDTHDQAGKSKRVFKNIEVLKKSRSMAFFFHRRKDEDENYEKKIEMKGGFWSKLLLPRRNKKLMHSRTTRERVITTAY